MVICNIIVNKKDDIIKKYENEKFINIVDKHWKIVNDLPTLIYGYKFAKELYPELVSHNDKIITKNIQWTYSESEYKNKCTILDFISYSVKKHTQNYANNIDVIFDNRNFDFKSFVRKIDSFPLIHAGKYEIYVGEIKNNGSAIIHSFQMDNLKYAGIDPETFFYDLLNAFERECIVFSTDEIDITKLKILPISFQDLIQASQNEILSFGEIIRTFKPYVKELSKEMVLTYFLRHSLYSKKLFAHFI